MAVTLRQALGEWLLGRLHRWVGKVTYKPSDPTLQAIFGLGDQRGELKNAYRQLPVVHTCIKRKASNIAQVPFLLFDINGEEPLEQGGIVDLFESFNPVLSKYDFWEALVINLETTGRFAIWPDPVTDRNGIPVYLWVFPGGNVKPRFRDGVWVGWEIERGRGRDNLIVPKEEIIYGKYFHPENDIEGLAPLESIALQTKLKWNSLRYSGKFFENDATPGLVLETDKMLEERQIEQLRHQLSEKRRGVNHAFDTLLLHNGMRAKNIAVSAKDIQLLEVMGMSTEEIAMVFGVPKSQLGIRDGLNYATARAEDLWFWKETLLPLMALIQDKLNQDLLRPLGYRGEFDTDQIDVLNEAILDKAEAAKVFADMGWPINQINDRLNLGFQEVEWGDEPQRQPAAPLIETIRERNVTPPAPRIPEPARITQEEIAKAQRSEKWRRLDTPLIPIQGKARAAIRRFFRETEQKIYRQLTKAETWAATKGIDDEIASVMAQIEAALDDDRLRRTVDPHIADGIAAGFESLEAAFDPTDPEIIAMIDQRVTRVVGVNETTRNAIREALKRALAEGMPEAQVAEEIMAVVREQMKIGQRRARTIARTEVNGAYSVARVEAMAQSRPPRKMWISSRDSKVRDSHQQLDGRIVPFDQDFRAGLAHPHDPRAPAEETVNCRCKLVAVFDEE